MTETMAPENRTRNRATDWLQTIDWARAIRRKGPALALAGGLALGGTGCTGAPSNPSPEASISSGSSVPATVSNGGTCPEDPKNATAADSKNPELIFSWLCGGADTVFVYHGPKDTPADRQAVGTYFGVQSEQGKNIAPAACYITDGRPVPSHPERGELQRPADIESHWFKLQTGAWAPETYSFNGPQLEQVLGKCAAGQLPAD